MTTEIIEIDNWFDLQLTISEYFYCFPDYIFRGHAQDDWKIESSLSRLLKESQLFEMPDDFIDMQLKNFKLNARGQGLDLSKYDENELWAIGQHYGLATPLIDWSYSPFVALFFALTGLKKSKTKKRALWAFCLSDLADIKYESNDIIEIINPYNENVRLINQNGLFLKM